MCLFSFRRICRWYGASILFALMLTLILSAAAISGCGGAPPAPVVRGNTMVTVVLSSTANDQLTEFDLTLQSITLTSQSGNTVTLLSAMQGTEFIHVNGAIEPLVTVSVPQDVYTSATATVGGAQFTCVELSSATGGIDTSTFAYGQTPSANVAVNLATPISITGNSMGLSLNLLVAQSAAYDTCDSGGAIDNYSITPTFNLTPAAFSSEPTSPENGKVIGLNGQISSVATAAGSFVLSPPELENPRTISVASAAGTLYQGINTFSDLAVGTFVNIDGAVRSDGSLVATRIAVEDPAATTVVTGPLLQISDLEPSFVLWGRQQQGALYADNFVLGGQYFSFGNAVFQVSGQLANLHALPFLPSFNAANIVPGQNVYLGTSSLLDSGGFPYTPLSTVTLLPQTIDGTVSGSSTNGNFTVYTVELAAYDLFPQLAVQQGQASLLNNPSEVQVYVDSSAQQLNSQPLAPGSTLRFYGLVFNDNGTLRMDCAQINDGVSVSPQAAQSSAQRRMEKGQSKIIRAGTLGRLHQTVRLITLAP